MGLMGKTANKTQIFAVSAAGEVTTTPLLTLNQNNSSAFKGIMKNGATITFTQDINDPIMAEFLSEYAPTTTETPAESIYEDGSKNTVSLGTSSVPQLLAVSYGGTNSDGSFMRRKVKIAPVVLSSASGDETWEYNKAIGVSLELVGTKWNGTSDITVPAAIFDDTLVLDSDTTNATHPTWKLPATVAIGEFGDEYWVKLPA